VELSTCLIAIAGPIHQARGHRLKPTGDISVNYSETMTKITCAGWQVTLYDRIWHVSSRGREAC